MKINEWTENLYTVPQNDPYALAPGAKITWTRLRAVVGARCCGAESPGVLGRSISAEEFARRIGEDWPITTRIWRLTTTKLKRSSAFGRKPRKFKLAASRKLLPAFRHVA